MERLTSSPPSTSLPDGRTRFGTRSPASGDQPLTARSVIASTLLGTHPPVLAAARLVRACALFDISEATSRVALSRMVAKGELSVDGGRYTLIGRLLERQSRQRWTRAATADQRWEGTWLVQVVTAEARDAGERNNLRVAMQRLRYAELRDGVWLRPDNMENAADPWSAAIVSGQCCALPGARPPEPTKLASRLFPLASWAAGARQLIADLDRWQPTLDRGDVVALAATFTLNAAVVRHLQHDPLLPDALLPRAWPGERLRARFERFDSAFVALWRGALLP